MTEIDGETLCPQTLLQGAGQPYFVLHHQQAHRPSLLSALLKMRPGSAALKLLSACLDEYGRHQDIEPCVTRTTRG